MAGIRSLNIYSHADNTWWNPSSAAFTAGPVEPWDSGIAKTGPPNEFSWTLDIPALAAAVVPGSNYSIYAQATDPSGNIGYATTTVTILSTAPPSSETGASAFARDDSGNLWTVNADWDNGQSSNFRLQKYDPAGNYISATPLPQAVEMGSFGMDFDASGNAWVVGSYSSNGPPGFAVWKVAAGGNPLLSSFTYNNPTGMAMGSDLSIDSSGNIWVPGLEQTSAGLTARFDLWKFGADGSLASGFPKTYQRPGGDLDGGWAGAVDENGNVWSAGISSNPATGRLDLALWKHGADGTLISGFPVFWPDAFVSIDRLGMGLTVSPVAVSPSGAVWVAASRIYPNSPTMDLAVLNYDQNGSLISSSLWHNSQGAAAGRDVVLDQDGNPWVVGYSSNIPAIWRYDAAGVLAEGYPKTTQEANFDSDLLVLSQAGMPWVVRHGSPVAFTGDVTVAGSTGPSIAPPAPDVALSPSSGPIGVPFSIAGTAFGAYAGANTRVKFGSALAPISVWNNTTISGTVPGLEPGTYSVAVERQHPSSTTVWQAGPFLLTSPSIAMLDPSTGPIGMPFSIIGTSFGPYNGANTRVLIGGATAPLSVWNDRTIQGTVPGILAPGAYDLKIERQAGAMTSASQVLSFTVTAPQATNLAPLAGPIGVPFTITGANFGPYNGANTRVLVGGTTAPLSVWNDTTIKGTMPGALAVGNHAVWVERAAPGGLAATATFYFEVTLPEVFAISPTSGPIGMAFILTGTSFGPYNGANTQVQVGTLTAALSLWNDTTIRGTIPGGLNPGPYPMKVTRRTSDNGLVESAPVYFQVAGLFLASIEPSSGPIGSPFTITGTDFDSYGGANTRVLIGGATAALSLWSDTRLQGTVPALPAGTYDVVVERENSGKVSHSNITQFQVLAPLALGMAPSSGPIGIPFTISGSGFGPYNGANTRVLVGGATAPLSVWNDTEIKGTIPGALAVGNHAVMVERVSSDGGLSRSATFQFEVTAPEVFSFEPSSGPIGMPFGITGRSFGPYDGANTRVLIGGTSAPLSLWNDTEIKGTIPGALAVGNHAVLVERASSDGGLASVQAGVFEIVTPVITGGGPSSGPIGTLFFINGTGFGPYNGANTRVKIGASTAPLSVWNDTNIQGTIPNLPVGAHDICVERQSGDMVSSICPGQFNVTLPAPAAITPSSGPIGMPFTITGTSFGPYNGANTRVLVGGTTAPLSVWNDTTIKGTIPGGLAVGNHAVMVERASSDGGKVSSSAGEFQVTVPAISLVTPSSAPVGNAFTISGANFGPYNGANTRVLIGGTTAPLSVWNDTTISGRIPYLPAGAQTIVVERATSDGGLIVSNEASITVVVPQISSMAPASGGTGIAFLLTGSGFGTYAGANTKVKFGDLSASLSFWSDTQIRGIVPDALAVGVHIVAVELTASGGLLRSNEVSYEVTGEPPPEGMMLMSSEANLPIAPDSGGKVEAPNRASVDVPPAAVEKEITVTLSRPTEKEDEREEARRNLPIAKVGEPVEFGPEGTRFSQHVTIELPFDPDMVPMGKTASDLALHYWNKEQKTWEALNTEVDLVRRKLKARTDHFSLYQPMVVGVQPEALAPGDFAFRDMYAFPNPARSRNPTIRVQVGQADSVDVHIYDVAGRLVDSASLTSGQILDDGNGKGPQWTYDCIWDVSGVGPGIYIYAVTARKAGCSPIRKTGKVGVIK